MRKERSNILFVTGTDTGVGKTLVTALLLRNLLERGIKVSVCKPVETGCLRDDVGHLHAEDGALLQQAAGSGDSPERIVPFRYELPLAPLIAAREENRPLEVSILEQHVLGMAEGSELLLVEGAGGLLVPLAEGYSFADFCERIAAETLLVVGSRLGALNQTLLTLEVIRQRGIRLAGYVLNDVFNIPGKTTFYDEAALRTNASALEELAAPYNAKYLGFLPYLGEKGGAECETGAATFINTFSDAIIEHFSLSR